jgi:signal transduction histidine kinase
MERILAPGPELAEQPRPMVTTLVPNAPSELSTSAPARSAARWLSPLDLLPLAYYLAVAIVLWVARYPGWRIAVLSGAAVAPQLGHFLAKCPRASRGHDPKLCVNMDPERFFWWAAISKAVFLVPIGVAVAVTGGIASPLFVTLIAPYVAVAAVAGDRIQTYLLLGATGVGVAVLAALPGPWTGPELPGSIHALLFVVSVLGVGALLAPVHARTRQWHADLARAREEVASEALARARSLEQIGSKLAHELKNPLTGIKALIQLGLRNPAEAPSHGRLEVVEREVDRMQEILQNHLSFTRPLQAVNPRRVQLGPLVSDALGALAARADTAGVRLYAQGDASIEADPRRLREALLNLVANAIEATLPGGFVEVEVRPTVDEAEIVIRDTGRGMPAETLRRIGTPFFTTRDEGTGLGVVLARSVIAQHGGSLRYDSEPGRGTRVRVALPRAPRGGGDAARAARG